MLKQLKRGLSFDRDELCLDLIRTVGPGGTFMDQMHTVKKMRTAVYLPKAATRAMRESWEREGRTEIGARALAEARSLLAGDNPARFDEETDRKILSRFPALSVIAENM